ncbi:MAG: DNA-processing protein DprA, partial [Acidimicrobiales bacterium]
AWLVQVLAACTPSQAWARVAAGRVSGPARGPRGRAGPKAAEMAGAASGFDVGRLWAYCQRAQIRVAWPGSPGYPAPLAAAPAPAGVLFSAGALAELDGRPTVAIVGTRRCTPDGTSVAWQLGYDLASAGVVVISGLALGIDGAAHAGALAAAEEAASAAVGTTVGVAASGVDVIYPRQHAALWRGVRRLGAIVSETPPGTPAQAWRFPSRNRVIAALARMVVVVESHATGGSWHTVDAALRLGTEVGAVPGPVRSSASVGTNTLLHEGATPVRGAADVLDVLGISAPGPAGTAIGAQGAPRRAGDAKAGEGCPQPAPARIAFGALESQVLTAMSWQPLCLEDIVERSGLPPSAVVVSLEALEQQGEVTGEAGWWSRCRAAPPGLDGRGRRQLPSTG